MARRWVADHREALAKADPDIPVNLHDRAADNWRPLLAIADVAGGDWPERARQAIRAIEPMDGDDDDLHALLLRDLRDLFTTRGTDKLASADICESLASQDDRPWPKLCDGKLITPHRLSRMLDPYGIVPTTTRIGGKTAKGYTLAQCQDAFARYIPRPQTVTSSQAAPDAASKAKSSRSMQADVTVSKSPQTRI